MQEQQIVPAARADVVAQQAQHIEALTQAVVNLRDRQNNTDQMARHAAGIATNANNYIERQKTEEAYRQAEINALYGEELVPYKEDYNKLPARYDDKNFWYLSLPLAHTGLFFKRISRWASSYLVTSASINSTRDALQEAHRERELLNIIRIQRAITKVERVVGNCIRKNRDSAVYKVGSNSAETEVIAHMLEKHFMDTGLCRKVVLTNDTYNLYLHLDIAY